MYDTILVPTDGSDGAEAAARHGLNLATAFDSQIHLLSVVDERSYSSALADLNPSIGEQREVFEQQATEAVGRLEELFSDLSVTCHTAVEHGIPHEAIRSYIAEHDIDLVSMGTHGRTGLDRLLLGSVTERVVRTSDVPVLTTRHEPDDRSNYDRILIPTDGSESATPAVDHGIGIAEQFDATVHALSVIDTTAFAVAYDGGPGIQTLLDTLEEGCKQAVAEVEDACENHNLDVVTEVVRGTPYRTIQEYVDDEGIDLITMGTHGRTGLERYLIGSVTERIVRTSDVPVLTVR
ncbi:universal stress protein [Halorubrum sp. CBA1125]|uniref:universal stress protein n=1 Tax=Halorubrum sp. CBA1125 TaxID=2668072 RepID=UPI0012E97977|nr:universal stress protein [Halorubrum sp. CBA1125]MUW14214.1 universal stress protein [Halorubrum sp. CBA1125]